MIELVRGDEIKRLFLSLIEPVLTWPRSRKIIFACAVDSSLCILASWFAYYLRLGEFVGLIAFDKWGQGFIWSAVMSVCIAIPAFLFFGLYRPIFRYGGRFTFLIILKAVSAYGFFYGFIFTGIGVPLVPPTIGVIQPIVLLLFVGGVRISLLMLLGESRHRVSNVDQFRVLVYGAGEAGRQLVNALINSNKMRVVGFLDDNHNLQGQAINGHIIYNPNNLKRLVSSLNVSYVLLALPKLERKRRNEILNQIRLAHVAVRTLPNILDLVEGKVEASDLHELDIDDLLGREPLIPNSQLMTKNVSGKVVMVTGAGGSIGGELCRQILMFNPSKLILIDHSEYALYKIHQDLVKKFTSQKEVLVPLLSSIKDKERMAKIMSVWSPHTIYHAAAYKHVPLVEFNVAEGIRNNLFGTMVMAHLALQCGVSDFVLISTDKAVRPTSIMGASKRLSEMVLQALAENGCKTKFSMVRFGNVLNSSGSVVPKFNQQIKDGGPITITHKDVTRYFMTISEASQLVIQAGAMAKGGDLFILDMGQPVKIVDLARRMIDLSGLTVRDDQNPSGDIEIEFIGLRHGEKLHEELLIGNKSETTSHPQIMRANEEFISQKELNDNLKVLESALNVNDINTVLLVIEKLGVGYHVNNKINDLVYLEEF